MRTSPPEPISIFRECYISIHLKLVTPHHRHLVEERDPDNHQGMRQLGGGGGATGYRPQGKAIKVLSRAISLTCLDPRLREEIRM